MIIVSVALIITDNYDNHADCRNETDLLFFNLI